MNYTIKTVADLDDKLKSYYLHLPNDYGDRIELYQAKTNNSIKNEESEEHFKNDFKELLTDIFKYDINTHKRIDYVIKDYQGNIKVLIEAKRPSNTTEMVSDDDFNRKAFHEILLYYYELKQDAPIPSILINKIIITNAIDVYIFNIEDFNEILKDKDIKNCLAGFKNKELKQIRTTNDLYNALKPIIASKNFNITALKFNLLDNSLNKNYICKALSKHYLFGIGLSNDANQLNETFYYELLHVMGLKEDSDNPLKLVKNDVKNSMIDITMQMVKTEENITDKAKQYDRALSLNILWINRILFLKLLESHLRVARDNEDFAILSKEFVGSFGKLGKLFFNVLNTDVDERHADDQVHKMYKYVPYLNSSLFSKTEEEKTCGIELLDNDREIDVWSGTITKTKHKKLNTLEYLLEFLNCYKFNRVDEGFDENTVIRSSVLGLIFEKLNSHKDGSHFTPASVSMYICRNLLQARFLKKFNIAFKTNVMTYSEIKGYLGSNYSNDNQEKACKVLDSISIIDPAVGSGHFLVSMLNELIYIRCNLGLFPDSINFKIEIVNDELHIKRRSNDEYFRYKVENGIISDERQLIQKYIFGLKLHIIQNQLYGVDINGDSINICRLRLWIELLKSSYFKDYEDKKFLKLEVLPNLEFKTMPANTLLFLKSRQDALFMFDSNQLKKYMDIYYNCNKRNDKLAIQKDVEKLLNDFKADYPQDEAVQNYNPFKLAITDHYDFFDSKLMFGIEKFDVVVANPPYIQLQTAIDDKGTKLGDLYTKYDYDDVFEKTGDIYALFYMLATRLCKDDKDEEGAGEVGFITSNKFMRAKYGAKLRGFLSKRICNYLLDLGSGVFDSATVDTAILCFTNSINDDNYAHKLKAVTLSGSDKKLENVKERDFVPINKLTSESWLILDKKELKLKDKLEKKGKCLKEWDIKINYGIKTGYNEAFIIDKAKYDELVASDPKSVEILKPILRGKDIKRYSKEWAGLYLVASHNGYAEHERINIDDYPAVKQHLDKHWVAIEKRQDQGATPYNLRNCTYYEDFSKPKIVYGEISQQAEFFYTEKEIYAEATSFVLTGKKLKYLTALFNSKAITYAFKKFYAGGGLGNTGYRYKKLYFSNLPIPKPTKEQESTITKLVDQIMLGKQTGDDTTKLENEIDTVVYEMFGLTDEEITMVEGE